MLYKPIGYTNKTGSTAEFGINVVTVLVIFTDLSPIW